jgi:hypothetical protein
MKYIPVLLTLSGLFLCALLAGCTSPTGTLLQPAETPPASPTATISTPAVTTTVSPVAIDTLPPEQYVDLQLTKERPDASIHLLFNGGKGQVVVQTIVLRVTRSDGQVLEATMNDGTRKPRQGDEVIVAGTRGNDRAEVFVTSAGKTYKVLDQPVVTPSS